MNELAFSAENHVKFSLSFIMSVRHTGRQRCQGHGVSRPGTIILSHILLDKEFPTE